MTLRPVSAPSRMSPLHLHAPAPLTLDSPAPAPVQAPKAPADRLLRLPSVVELCAIRRSAIYERMKNGSFPACIKIGRATAWRESQVQAWIAERSGSTAMGGQR